LNYYIKNPKDIYNLPISNAIQHQLQGHRLSWKFGDIIFEEAMQQIQENVATCEVYIKGREKCCFLKEYIPNLIEMPTSPSIETMNSCLSDVCDTLHGKYCAKRKVHELRYIDYNRQCSNTI